MMACRCLRAALAAAILLPMALTAQRGTEGTIPLSQLGPAGSLELVLQWGTMVVTGGDVPAITYRIVRDLEGPKRDSLRRLPEAVPYHLETTSAGVSLKMTESDGQGFTAGRLEVTVPRRLRFLHLEMMRGGSITVRGFDGDLTILNHNGDTDARDLGGPLVIEANNGSVIATIRRTAADQPVSIMARNGGITFDVMPGNSGTISVETRSGRITSSGPIAVEHATEPGRSTDYRPTRATVQFGSGGPRIRLLTLNGDVALRLPH